MNSIHSKSLKLLSVFFSLILALYSEKSLATHAAGADFTYKSLGGLKYELTLTFYRDCGGVAEPNTVDFNYRTLTGSYTSVRTVTATKDLTSGQEITSPCTSAVTKCNGGSYTGIRQWKYKAEVTLPGAATDWVFSYSLCCRNCAITTINTPCTNGVSNLYVEATLNNIDGPQNNSPTFSNVPIAFVYIGQNFNYNHGVLDEDGDSLVYSLITPRFNATTNVTWVAPHNTSTPILSSTPFNVNALTGDLNFTPSQSEVGIMTVLVREYRNKKLIGSVIRDMQVYTSISTNSLPTASGINGTNNYSMNACPNTPVCFNIYTQDLDSIQNVNISTNNGINGATYTYVNGRRPHLQFCWTPTFDDISSLPHIFTLTVKDDACGLNGIQTYSYMINVPAPYFTAASTNVACYGASTGTASATPVHGNVFSYLWSNGATTQNLTNLPAGTYTVTATDAPSGCSASTSVVITQPAGLNITGNKTNPSCAGVCNGAIDLSVSGGSGYTYLWSNGASTEDVSGLCAGTYTVTVTHSTGCSQTASFTLSNSYSMTASTTQNNVLCRTAATGTINLSVNNGTPSYSYLWSNGSTTQNQTALAAGTYTVTATDANGCTAQSSATLTQPATVLSSTISSNTSVTCFGLSNGAASVTASGGTSPYTYIWSNGNTTTSINSLAAGNYIITVSDANGCTSQQTATITQPAAALSASVSSSTNVKCFGNTTGNATATSSGGTTPYTYSWSNGASGTSNNNIASGTYTVTVTDNKGCTASTSVTISQPSAALSISTTADDVNCRSGNDGSITATPSGGTTPYIYNWNNGSTAATNTSLTAGTYTVTVTDANNCTATATKAVTQPAAALSLSTTTTTAVSCYDGSNGSATVAASGGTSPYNYSWSNGSTSATNSNLDAGTYTVTVTDAQNCTASIQVEITQPAAALASVLTPTNVLCNGNNTGSIANAVSGGTTPYSYNWNIGATTMNLSNATAGSYTVTVTDSKGCTTSRTATVSQPLAALSATTSATPVLCRGNTTGSITVTPSGGTSPYTYNWNNGATTATASNLAAGNYTVTVTDANNCTSTQASLSITQPAAVLSVTQGATTQVSCFGLSNGVATVTGAGGTSPYTYLWSNGNTTSTANNLSSGTYTVTITDANNCATVNSPITITQPAAALSSAISSNTTVSCYGLSNGSATASATGGTPTYTYQWSNGNTTATASSLAAGSYTVTITDNKGCTSQQTAVITQPSAALATASTSTNVLCFGNNTGAINLNASGGTTPYTYNWSNSQTTQNISGLTAGNYTVTVTDNRGCTTSAIYSVTQPAATLTQSGAITHADCRGNSTGSVILTVNGGAAPYSYNWSNSTSASSATALSAGTYNVTVTDANNCTSSASYTVTQPAAILSYNLTTHTSVSCYGLSNATATVSASGGTAPYTYLWSNGTTTASNNNIPAGTYTVTITDSKNCATTSANIVISQPSAPLAAGITPENVKCFAGNSGTTTTTITGGTSPYTYQWNTGATTSGLSGLTVGTYTVTATDVNGCTATASATLTQPSASLSLSTTKTDINCLGNVIGSVDLSVSGGTSPYTYIWSNGSTQQDITNLTAATYQVTVTDGNGCTAATSATVTQPAGALSVSSAITAVKCFGNNTGAIDITASAGTPPYSYAWSNGATTADLTSLTAGSYTLTITDANGCVLNNTLFVTQPTAALSTTAVSDAAKCFGDNTGAITLTVNGGTSTYNYVWSNGATTKDLSSVTSGTYSVTVTDANLCTTTASYTVSQPAEALNATATQNNLNCHDVNDGVIDLTVTGGTSPYTYAWSNSMATQDISSLTPGTYNVNITDNNGCKLSKSYEIIYNALQLAATSTNSAVPCNGDATGSIDLQVSGGTAPFQFNWSNNATSEDLNNVASGNYAVTITDNNGCTATFTTGVNQPSAALNVSAFKTDELCHADHGALIDITVNGGTGPYTYNWNNGISSEDLTGVTAGTYNITVTDNNGCTWTNSYSISGPPAPLAAATTANDPLCNGDNTGSIDLTLSGGTAPYQVTWNTGATGTNLSNVPTGTYIATVKDANQCETIQTITLNQPSQALATTAQTTNIDCFSNSTGTITLSPTGGTAPYSYQWSNGATTDVNSQLTAGNYDYTITDAHNCIYNGSASISQPANFLQANVTISAALCNGDATGSIDLNVSGGTPGYSFLWSNNATTEDLSQLSAGTYIVTVTDANQCVYSNTYTVTEPQASLAAAVSSSANVNCFGNATGSISMNITGGTSPYTYSWNTGATTANITQLPSGNYTVLVTDANGCSTTSSTTITQPTAALSTNGSVTAVACNGFGTGAIDVTVNGGTAPYSYNWNTGVTSEDIAQLEAGTYTVTITDNQQCVSTLSFNVNEPQSAISNTLVVTDILCSGNSTGSISSQVIGGTAPYTYQWNTGAQSSSISNLNSGMYVFTVTDAHGCIYNDSATVGQPAAALAVTTTAQNLKCTGDHSGAINLNVSGGTGTYNYQWNTGATTMNISNLNAGTYTITVTDVNNCSSVQTVQIQQPQQMLVVGSTVSNVSCFGMNNGSITLNISGGDPVYTINWNNGSTASSINNLAPGMYSATVTDNNGCVINSSFNLLQPTASLNMIATASASNCLQGVAGSVQTVMTGGTQPYQYIWSNGSTTSSLNNIYTGTYTVTATDVNGCTATQTVTIDDQSVLNLNTNGPVQICAGTTTTLSATSVPGVQYQWSYNNVPLIGATQSSFTTPAGGTYTLTATSACGTYTSAPIRVITRSLNNVSISNSFIICPGEQAQLLAGGGVGYVWSPSNGLSNANIPNPVASPKKTTEYTVTITDDFGCKATASVTVSVMCDTLDIPNGFSPNSDGTNDYFVIDGLSQYPENTLFIYNRWGNLVYKMGDYDNSWNGTSNVSGIYLNRTLPNGTYYYILDLKNDQKPLNGFVVLKR